MGTVNKIGPFLSTNSSPQFNNIKSKINDDLQTSLDGIVASATYQDTTGATKVHFGNGNPANLSVPKEIKDFIDAGEWVYGDSDAKQLYPNQKYPSLFYSIGDETTLHKITQNDFVIHG